MGTSDTGPQSPAAAGKFRFPGAVTTLAIVTLLVWQAFSRSIARFFKITVWSWIP